MMRTTLYLDDKLGARLKRLVPPRKLNRFVNEVLAEKVEELESDQLAAEMKAGYLAARRDRKALAADWSAVDTEDWPS